MLQFIEINFFSRAPARDKKKNELKQDRARFSRIYLALFRMNIHVTLIVCFSFQKLAFHAKDLKTEYLEIFNVFKIWNKSNPVAVLYFPFVFLDKCSSRKDEQRRVKICYLVYRLHHKTDRFKLEWNFWYLYILNCINVYSNIEIID